MFKMEFKKDSARHFNQFNARMVRILIFDKVGKTVCYAHNDIHVLGNISMRTA